DGVYLCNLDDDVFDNFAADVGEAKIAAGVAIGKLVVIEAKQVKHRRVQVVNVDRVFFGAETKFIDRAVNRAAFKTAARQPHGESIMVMIASFAFAGRAGRGNLDGWGPAKLTTTNHQR